jgi:hypothetical protein
MSQQPEPSGSEAGESRVRNRVRESFVDKANHSCSVGFYKLLNLLFMNQLVIWLYVVWAIKGVVK